MLWYVCSWVYAGIAAASRQTVEVKVPGTLSELIGAEDKWRIKELEVIGTLNSDDLRFLREMAGRDEEQLPTQGRLRSLNLRSVSFAQGGKPYVKRKEGLTVQGAHTLPSYLFSNCFLEEVVLPERLDTLAEGVFSGTLLKRVALPERVCVMASAFYGCIELKEVDFPQCLRTLSRDAFGECWKLKSLSMNDVDYIAAYAFSKMPAVERIEINGDLGHIDGWYTFSECPHLKTVDFRGVVMSTGGSTLLSACPQLEHVTFHDDVLVTNIGEAVDCPKLDGYTIKGRVWQSSHTDCLLQMSESERPKGVHWVDFAEPFAVLTRRIQSNGGDVMQFMRRNLSVVFYDLACGYALDERKSEALDALELSMEMGWADYVHTKSDTDLEFLHGDFRFEKLLAQLREVGDYLYILRGTPPYRNEEKALPPFTYLPPTDSNLVRVRRYFNLDSIAGDGDEISRIKNVMYWLHDEIRHDGGSGRPKCGYNSIEMYEVCKREGRGLNCRFLAQTLNEMYLALGFPSRFLTCQSKAYDTDPDCHVINMVWSRQLDKWIWIDPSFAAYVTDENGLLLHPGEVRERLAKGLPLVLNEDANWNHKQKQTKEYYIENYMAKNLYYLSAYRANGFETEGDGPCSSYVTLAPEGLAPAIGDITHDEDYFWQQP